MLLSIEAPVRRKNRRRWTRRNIIVRNISRTIYLEIHLPDISYYYNFPINTLLSQATLIIEMQSEGREMNDMKTHSGEVELQKKMLLMNEIKRDEGKCA